MNYKLNRRSAFVKNQVLFEPYNGTKQAMEERQNSTFVYRMHNEAKINRFVAKIYGKEGDIKTINAQIDDIHQAEQKFRNAKDNDQEAVIAKIEKDARDCFTIDLGQIRGGSTVKVEFDYFMDLTVAPAKDARTNLPDMETLRLFIPIEIKRRFKPENSETSTQLNDEHPDQNDMLVKIYIESNPQIMNITGKIPSDSNTDIDRIVIKRLGVFSSIFQPRFNALQHHKNYFSL